MKIFILVSRFPYPIDKGDKLRIYNQLKQLSKTNEIVLFALNDEKIIDKHIDLLSEFCSKTIVQPLSKQQIFINLLRSLFNRLPFQVSYFYSLNVKKKINREIDEFKPDVIFCQLIRMTEYVKDIKKIPLVIDYVDAISKGLEKRIENSNIFLKSLIKIEHTRVARYEEEVFHKFHKRIIITEQDRDYLNFKERNEIEILQNGIDTQYFHPINCKKEYDIFFNGNLSYPPNVTASILIAKSILPLLKKNYPNIRILIAGANPTRAILNLESENIFVKGWIDDIREYYSKSKIFLAPLQLGTGLQNKILQAMAMKIPCITSSICQQGIKASGNESILVANTPEEYVDCISKLMEDEAYSRVIAENAFNFVQENFSWVNLGTTLEIIFQEAITK